MLTRYVPPIEALSGSHLQALGFPKPDQNVFYRFQCKGSRGEATLKRITEMTESLSKLVTEMTEAEYDSFLTRCLRLTERRIRDHEAQA